MSPSCGLLFLSSQYHTSLLITIAETIQSKNGRCPLHAKTPFARGAILRRSPREQNKYTFVRVNAPQLFHYRTYWEVWLTHFRVTDPAGILERIGDRRYVFAHVTHDIETGAMADT
jgi:hypothetical protein